jgi:large subunit ribosomal protein L35Ae
MQGLMLNFRGGKHTKSDNQMIMELPGVDSRDKAQKHMGKIVTWKSPAGKEIKGKITNVHGNKGVMRVQFEKGMPGQAVGSTVEVS